MAGIKSYITTIVLVLCFSSALCQNTLPYFNFSRGLGIVSADSTFSINTRFRIQNRAAFTSESLDNLSISEVEARIRRLRLRFEGFVYSPQLTYVIQLSFSRGDMDFEATNFPNVIRDAYVQYALNKHLSVGIGQTKLPGNRQRVISSGDLQLSDRSIVNGAFNLDRDFGIQANYRREYFTVRAAISSGEGRNITNSDHGLAYTGRVELLPFGAFDKGSDYFEGDLTRHKRPKLSFGLVYHFNENAVRTGGQLGYILKESRDLRSRMIDVLFKMNGWAFSAEYLDRSTGNAMATDIQGNSRYVYVGNGQNYQLSYVLKKQWELVGRYSVLNPHKQIQAKEKSKEQFTIGINKYLRAHRVKIQNDLTLEQWHLHTSPSASGGTWRYTFQIELGI